MQAAPFESPTAERLAIGGASSKGERQEWQTAGVAAAEPTHNVLKSDGAKNERQSEEIPKGRRAISQKYAYNY